MIVKIINKEILNNFARFLFVYGNRGGGKSTTVINKMIKDTVENPKSKTLMVRKTHPSLEITVIRMVNEELVKWGIPHRATRGNITFPNGSLIDFQSLYLTGGGRNERINSTTYDRVLVEEATEFTVEDFGILNEVLRGDRGINQMILAFNPPARNTNPIYKWYDIKKKKADRVFFDNINNPYISKEYRDELSDLKEYDIGRYKRYALGQWGVDTKQELIYPNWIDESVFPECDQIVYGIDFGFTKPTAIVKVGIKERDIYLQELLYETKLTNGDLIGKMNGLDITSDIFADSAEPARIEAIGRADYTISKANKKVSEGITAVRDYKIHIVNSPNFEAEIKEYVFKKDRDGHISEDPVKLNDHLMDAMRYAIMGVSAGVCGLAFG